jgi:hypothetical protein
LDADVAFQLLDLPTQRRLGHAEVGGGTPEVQLVGHRDETTELLKREVHAAKVSIDVQ